VDDGEASIAKSIHRFVPQTNTRILMTSSAGRGVTLPIG